MLDKRQEDATSLVPIFDGLVSEWRRREVPVSNSARLSQELWKRRSHFRSPALRPDRSELDREIDRVFRALFGQIRGLDDDTGVSVTLRPLGRKGLSAALTVEAEVHMGTDAVGKPVVGNRCVVKIGPRDDIREEVDRYDRFVKFGVRLAQRVELLSATAQDRLGAVCYSFAGGVFGRSLMTLDELFRQPEHHALATQAIRRLFNPQAKNWYDVRCPDQSPLAYMHATYHTDFDRCYDYLHGGLRKIAGQFRKGGYALNPADGDGDGAFDFPGGTLLIPATDIGGRNEIWPSRPSCLVHGDMHGGNVMIELGDEHDDDESGETLKRVCLIDYRSAGPGPRAIDVIAVQASIRLADAQIISDQLGGGVDIPPKGENLRRAINLAASRARTERALLDTLWSHPPDPDASSIDTDAQWESTASLLTHLMRMNFTDMSRNEYLAVAIPCALRQCSYDISKVARVRVAAWLSALYEALRDGA
jgi:hypothetical protein